MRPLNLQQTLPDDQMMELLTFFDAMILVAHSEENLCLYVRRMGSFISLDGEHLYSRESRVNEDKIGTDCLSNGDVLFSYEIIK